MSNYKDMYLTLFRATEDAIELLINAQRSCEENFIEAPEEDLSGEEEIFA